jgi:hypothetical protein
MGKGDLLVQRVVEDPNHCGFMASEWEEGLEDLVAWVEEGKRPDGDDVLVSDLRQVGKRFTRAPRFGGDAASQVPGAAERIEVSGTASLDGAPLDGEFVWVEVVRDGLRHACDFEGPETDGGGHYTRTVASDAELKGCAAPGARLQLATAQDGRVLRSQPVDMPAGARTLQLNAAFTASGAQERATYAYGEAFDPQGDRFGPGTVIEAWIGDTLCGRTAIPYVGTAFTSADSYSIFISGADEISGCAEGGAIEFSVQGRQATETLANDLTDETHRLDLTTP